MSDNRRQSDDRRQEQDRRNPKPKFYWGKERRKVTVVREADVFEIYTPPLIVLCYLLLRVRL
jgi:hypothetical protein